MEKLSKIKNISVLILLVLWMASCSDKPKVIEAEAAETYSSPFNDSNSNESGSSSQQVENSNQSNLFHKVVIDEILPTSKYVYLKVKEGALSYWIATKKMEVQKGETYYYRNGLLKTNFESKEYNRIFDKLYLVSSIVPETHGNKTTQKEDIEMHAFEGEEGFPTVKNENSIAGDITSIAELVRNKESMVGNQIKVRGKCTKVNSKIMGRNWIHLKDGSMDDFDLVVTSHVEVPIGDEVTMTATVALNKDFGSGYYYELLLENGKLMISL